MSCFDRKSWLLKYECAWSLTNKGSIPPKPLSLPRAKKNKHIKIPYDPEPPGFFIPASQYKEYRQIPEEPLRVELDRAKTANSSLDGDRSGNLTSNFTLSAPVSLDGNNSSSSLILGDTINSTTSITSLQPSELIQNPSLITKKTRDGLFEIPSIHNRPDPNRPLLRIIYNALEKDPRRNHIGAAGGHIHRLIPEKLIKGGPLEPMKGTKVIQPLKSFNVWDALPKKKNKDGTPAHPLYLNSQSTPIPYLEYQCGS